MAKITKNFIKFHKILSYVHENHFIFPTYVQMYPYSKDRPFLKQVREKLRYYGYKWLYQKQCHQLVDFLNTETQWQSLFTQDYYRINTILTTFAINAFLLQNV